MSSSVSDNSAGQMSRSQRHKYLRAKIIVDLVRTTFPNDVDIAHALSLGSFLHLNRTPGQNRDNEETQTKDVIISGGLSQLDIRRFENLGRKLETSKHDLLLEQVDSTLLSISDFFHRDAETEFDQRHRHAWSLPDDLETYILELKSLGQDIAARRAQCEKLVKQINEIHKDLHTKLIHSLSTYPPALNKQQRASADLQAAKIETALMKLALLRARVHHLFYMTTGATTQPNKTMAMAIPAAYKQLKGEERKMVEEERILDKQLDEYDRLLALVDGTGSGFKQVVKDWVKVQEQTEECRKDLRRLGWTGD